MNKQYGILSSTEINAIIFAELAESIKRYRNDQVLLIERNSELSRELERERGKSGLAFDVRDKLKAERDEQKARVDDLARQLAVTERKLDEARKRLERYEGGGD